MTSQILRFTDKPLVDESLQEYEFHEYEPQARTNLNHAGEITLWHYRIMDDSESQWDQWKRG